MYKTIFVHSCMIENMQLYWKREGPLGLQTAERKTSGGFNGHSSQRSLGNNAKPIFLTGGVNWLNFVTGISHLFSFFVVWHFPMNKINILGSFKMNSLYWHKSGKISPQNVFTRLLPGRARIMIEIFVLQGLAASFCCHRRPGNFTSNKIADPMTRISYVS